MVTVIVPNWNGGRRLADVLGDLASQTQPPARILVVDNGSTDGSAVAVRAQGADVLELGSNLGFASAVNRGLADTKTELVAIVNNDVRLEASWLEHLVRALREDETIWFATGKIYSLREKGVLDGSFDAICRGACSWRCGHGRPDSEIWDRPRRISSAPFTAVLFRGDLFRQLGVLDEAFESYLEDVDFGLRCAVAGRCGGYVPQSVARHWGSATLGVWHPETVRRIARNQLYLVAKHYPKKWLVPYGWPVLVAQLLYGLVALRRGTFLAYVRGKWEGVRDFRLHRRELAEPECLRRALRSSERTLYELQQYTGFDLYWRLYFLLTGRSAG